LILIPLTDNESPKQKKDADVDADERFEQILSGIRQITAHLKKMAQVDLTDIFRIDVEKDFFNRSIFYNNNNTIVDINAQNATNININVEEIDADVDTQNATNININVEEKR